MRRVEGPGQYSRGGPPLLLAASGTEPGAHAGFPNLQLCGQGRAVVRRSDREPRAALKFFTKYKDRVLFGTGMGRNKALSQGWWRLLESGDDFMPGRLWWRQYGLELPAPVLEALYRGNARRVLSWAK